MGQWLYKKALNDFFNPYFQLTSLKKSYSLGIPNSQAVLDEDVHVAVQNTLENMQLGDPWHQEVLDDDEMLVC